MNAKSVGSESQDSTDQIFELRISFAFGQPNKLTEVQVLRRELADSLKRPQEYADVACRSVFQRLHVNILGDSST